MGGVQGGEGQRQVDRAFGRRLIEDTACGRAREQVGWVFAVASPAGQVVDWHFAVVLLEVAKEVLLACYPNRR